MTEIPGYTSRGLAKRLCVRMRQNEFLVADLQVHLRTGSSKVRRSELYEGALLRNGIFHLLIKIDRGAHQNRSPPEWPSQCPCDSPSVTANFVMSKGEGEGELRRLPLGRGG